MSAASLKVMEENTKEQFRSCEPGRWTFLLVVLHEFFSLDLATILSIPMKSNNFFMAKKINIEIFTWEMSDLKFSVSGDLFTWMSYSYEKTRFWPFQISLSLFCSSIRTGVTVVWSLNTGFCRRHRKAIFAILIIFCGFEFFSSIFEITHSNSQLM